MLAAVLRDARLILGARIRSSMKVGDIPANLNLILRRSAKCSEVERLEE